MQVEQATRVGGNTYNKQFLIGERSAFRLACSYLHSIAKPVEECKKSARSPTWRQAERSTASALSFLPMALALILTHNLQTEVKSKMSALKQCLQGEPPFPDSSPSRRTITAAGQVATETSHLRPEGAQRHGSRQQPSALSQHGKHQRLNHLVSRALWLFTSVRT